MPVSGTTPGHAGACDGAPVCVAFRFLDSVGARNFTSIAAQWLAYAYPCQRFTPHLTMRRA